MSNEVAPPAEPLSGTSFPPLAGTKWTDRKQFFQTCTFLKIRKASTENPNYVNPDGTSLLTYSETLSIDRDLARTKMLDHELAKGWLADDRGAVVTVAQGMQPVAPTNGAPMTVGFSQAPAPQQVVQPQFAPQQVATPAQAVAVAQQAPSAPPQMAAPTEMPLTKTRRAAPKYGSAVAPPPPGPTNGQAPMAFQVPAPPPGAQVVQQQAPVAFQQPVQFQPAPQAPAPVVQQPVQAASGPTLDLGPIVARVDELGRGLSHISSELETQKGDFKTMVGNLSAQINETNKALANLQKTAEFLLVAAHHMYITNKPTADASAGKAADIRQFKDFLTTYLDPAANPQ